jgi:hypothetical protein
MAFTSIFVCGQAYAQLVVTAAPAGDAATVAKAIIRQNFDPADCPTVKQARRLSDGSIRAFCSNGESFRIGVVNSKQFALRCSAAAKMGVAC